MEMKEIFKRYLVFVIGLYFLAAGIVLIIRSALGTTPISSINYVLSLNSPLSLGTCTFIINMVLILGQFWLIRKNRTRQDIIEILLQLPFSFIFSAFIDFNMMLTSELHPANYGMSIALLLTGCMVQSIGVVLELKPKVAMMSAEAFVKYASRHYNKEFGKFKVYFDITKQPILQIAEGSQMEMVLSVGMDKSGIPLITISNDGNPICYRLPEELSDWALMAVGMANMGENLFPSQVVFTKKKNRYFADIL